MPNFKCQNNLKDPKHAVERQATFYSLSFSKYFCISLVFNPIPNFAKQNPLVIDQEIELITTLNSFAGAVKTYWTSISILVSKQW